MAVDGRLPRRHKSHEMDEHLKTLYPYAKTPQERMRECNINLMKMHNDMSCPRNDAPLAVEDDIFSDLLDFSTYSELQDGSSQYNNAMGNFETLYPTTSPSHYIAPAALGVGDIYAANYGSLHADSGLDSSSSSMGSFENSPRNYTSLYYSAPLEFQTPYMDNPLSVGSSSSQLSPATINSQSSPERQPSPIPRRQVSTDADIEPTAAPLVMVLSAKDMATVAQRTRAKYSAQKRKEVHETRKRGACEECRRRKKKCVHVTLMDSAVLSERPTAASNPARRPQPSNDGGATPGHPSRPMSPQRTANTASATPQVHQVHKGGYDCSPTGGARGSHVGIVEPDTSPEASQSPFPPESDFVLFPEDMDHTLPPPPTNMDLMWMDQRYIYSSADLFNHVEATPTQDGLNPWFCPGTSGAGKTAMTSIATSYPQTQQFEHTRQAPHFTASWKEFDEAIESLLTGSPGAVVEPNECQRSQRFRDGPNTKVRAPLAHLTSSVSALATTWTLIWSVYLAPIIAFHPKNNPMTTLGTGAAKRD
ncbi:MAG: hypothetical protein M1839_006421 [Geoglossum umbratile]|nr:MAG: hypothetical protein M1839_006421 [Geoglossum umbratile]